MKLNQEIDIIDRGGQIELLSSSWMTKMIIIKIKVWTLFDWKWLSHVSMSQRLLSGFLWDN